VLKGSFPALSRTGSPGHYETIELLRQSAIRDASQVEPRHLTLTADLTTMKPACLKCLPVVSRLK